MTMLLPPGRAAGTSERGDDAFGPAVLAAEPIAGAQAFSSYGGGGSSSRRP